MLLNLQSKEYCTFLIWCFLMGKTEDLGKEDATNILQKIAEFAVEMAADQTKVKNHFLKWNKLLEQMDEEFSLQDLSSIDMRSGGPVTTLLTQMIKTLKDTTLGSKAWKRICANSRQAIENLRSKYYEKLKNDHVEHVYDFEIHNQRKRIREEVRAIARMYQNFYLNFRGDTEENAIQSSQPSNLLEYGLKLLGIDGLLKREENQNNVNKLHHEDHQIIHYSIPIDENSATIDELIEFAGRIREEALNLRFQVKSELL